MAVVQVEASVSKRVASSPESEQEPVKEASQSFPKVAVPVSVSVVPLEEKVAVPGMVNDTVQGAFVTSMSASSVCVPFPEVTVAVMVSVASFLRPPFAV